MTKVFKTPFAAQGDRTAVPVETQADGSVSYTQGYGYDYERDQTTDPAAKDIEREKMNALFHDVTEAVGEIQVFGAAVWSEDGKPYAIRSQAYYGKKLWQSKIENNNEEPGKGSGWIELKADLTPADIGALPTGGTAVAATRLATPRTIGGTSFDGTANITPANCTNAVQATKLQTARTIAGVNFDGTANIAITARNVGALPAGGTAVAATKLATPRTIAGVKFDGTANISIPAGNVGAYTKAEVDARINAKGAKNTASKAARGWWKCGDTGVIFQWGTVGLGNDLPVTFPITFPAACISVQISQNSSMLGTNSTSNISATGKSRTGFTSHVYSNERGADWLAIGY